MEEMAMYRALTLAEGNLRIGCAPRVAVEKVAQGLNVNLTELALLLLAKVHACREAREERILLDAYDRMLDGLPPTGSPTKHFVRSKR